MEVTFHGVRGSFPCSTASTRRYGGHTASVSLHAGGELLLLFDMGTGLAALDVALDGASGAPPELSTAALVTHLHLDHIHGLPFFRPLLHAGTTLDIYAPRQPTESLREAFGRLLAPPLLPLCLDDLPARIAFHDVVDDQFSVGRVTVTARPVPHKGPTVGYRVECDGLAVAYISDHQAPADLLAVDDGVLELCRGVDLLIHEAQYTPEEFAEKPRWGHCTPDYALRVAQVAGARRLCLFHHDPWRSDDDLDAIVAAARQASEGTAVAEVLAATEGTTITL